MLKCTEYGLAKGWQANQATDQMWSPPGAEAVI